MAFLKSSQLFMKNYIRSEVIFNNIIKQNIPISTAVNKYLEEIKNLQMNQKDADISEFLDFPGRTFYKLNKKCLENIISNSYDIFKQKGIATNPSIYEALLECYLKNDIDIDIECILADMAEYQVSLNSNIFGKIIKYFSVRGKMNFADILLNEMKSKGIGCPVKDKYFIVSGYIISGQPEKAEIFIKENKLNMESHDMFYSRCFGYASIADVTSLKIILEEMKEKDIKFSSNRFYNLYERLIYGNVDVSNLNEIIDLTKDSLANSKSKLYELVVHLNSVDKFNYSLYLIEKLTDLIDEGFGFICTFGTSRCPLNTFQQALTILLGRCRAFPFNGNIFGDMKFEIALMISQNFTENRNWKIIHISLINKAIIQKSQFFIENALKFSKKHLKWTESNLMIFKSLSSMKSSGLVSDFDEIVDMFPRFKNDLLPLILLKYLCTGDFDGYDKLRLKHLNIKYFSPHFDWNYLALELCRNLSLGEIKKWSMEASKCFHEKLINNTLSHIIINELVKLLNNESFEEIEQLISYTKEWNIEFSQFIIDNLLNAVPEQAEFIRGSIAAKFGDGKKELNCAN